MKTVSHIFVLLGILFSFSARGDEAILWWLVEPGDTVEDWYGSESTVSKIGATAFRLRVDGGQEPSYLDFQVRLPSGDMYTMDGERGSPLPMDSFANVAAYVPDELSGAEYTFSVELGNIVDGQWVKTLAASAPVSYNWLQSEKHIGSWSDINADLTGVWSPSGYSVPEPSSGLLMLIGGALLALRRRRGT